MYVEKQAPMYIEKIGVEKVDKVTDPGSNHDRMALDGRQVFFTGWQSGDRVRRRVMVVEHSRFWAKEKTTVSTRSS